MNRMTKGTSFEHATAQYLFRHGYTVNRPAREQHPETWQQRYGPDLIIHKLGKTYWIDCKASSYGNGQYVSVSRAALGAGLLHENDRRRYWFIFDNGHCATPTHLMTNKHRWAQGAGPTGSGDPRIQNVAGHLPLTRDMFR